MPSVIPPIHLMFVFEIYWILIGFCGVDETKQKVFDFFIIGCRFRARRIFRSVECSWDSEGYAPSTRHIPSPLVVSVVSRSQLLSRTRSTCSVLLRIRQTL